MKGLERNRRILFTRFSFTNLTIVFHIHLIPCGVGVYIKNKHQIFFSTAPHMLLKDLFNYADSVLTYTLLFGKSSFNTITLDFGIEGGVKK